MGSNRIDWWREYIRNDGRLLVYVGVSSSDLGEGQVTQFRTGLKIYKWNEDKLALASRMKWDGWMDE